eukprot:1188020-Prorocentrum_minimum.AAC.1
MFEIPWEAALQGLAVVEGAPSFHDRFNTQMLELAGTSPKTLEQYFPKAMEFLVWMNTRHTPTNEEDAYDTPALNIATAENFHKFLQHLDTIRSGAVVTLAGGEVVTTSEAYNRVLEGTLDTNQWMKMADASSSKAGGDWKMWLYAVGWLQDIQSFILCGKLKEKISRDATIMKKFAIQKKLKPLLAMEQGSEEACRHRLVSVSTEQLEKMHDHFFTTGSWASQVSGTRAAAMLSMCWNLYCRPQDPRNKQENALSLLTYEPPLYATLGDEVASAQPMRCIQVARVSGNVPLWVGPTNAPFPSDARRAPTLGFNSTPSGLGFAYIKVLPVRRRRPSSLATRAGPLL